jgi:tRNA A-37 threonylcarbamoyl transferase component Bud32
MPDTTHAAPFPTAEELGAALPQYEVEECISMGEESAIYRARQPALERAVMIRVMAEPTAEAAARLMERLRARARLVHPRVVAVYDFGRTMAGSLYLVTEHVDGRMLNELIQERKVPPKLAFTLALQLCDVITLLHGQGSMHGALSTRTLLVDQEGQIKVTGIGMCVTPSGEISWLHEGIASLEQDLYALGLVLHEMFGREPLPEDGRVSRNLPPAFGAVIRRCVHPDPVRRFTSADEVKSALVQALRTQQQSAAAKAAPAPPAASKPAAPAERAVVSQPPAQAAAPVVPAAAPAQAPAQPVYAPPRYAPGRPPAPVVRAQPSFFRKLDDFLWSCLKAGLHLTIFFVTASVLLVFHIMKDKIVLNPDAEKDKPAEAALPGEVLGRLPEAPVLPQAPVTPMSAPITLPAPMTPAPSAPSPTDTALASLDADYKAAVQAEATAALDKVRLNDLPALQRELQRLQNNEPLPATDDPGLPATLKKLREDYRQKRAALTK